MDDSAASKKLASDTDTGTGTRGITSIGSEQIVPVASITPENNSDFVLEANQPKNGPSLKVVTSILRTSTKGQQRKAAAAIIQRWCKTNHTGSVSETGTSRISEKNKTQQAILSSINAAAVTSIVTGTVTGTANISAPAPAPATGAKADAKLPVTTKSKSINDKEFDAAFMDSLLVEADTLLETEIMPAEGNAESDSHMQNCKQQTVYPPPHPSHIDDVQDLPQPLPPPPQRMKRVAAKTVLSQQRRPIISNQITSISTRNIPATDVANRPGPPSEVSIPTASKRVAIKRKAVTTDAIAESKKAKTNTKMTKLTGTSGTPPVSVARKSAARNSIKTDNLKWEGVPTDKVAFSVDWSKWMKRTYERKSGASKGSCDSYWYTPQQQYKLRSLKEVERFLGFFAQGNNEEAAWKALKNK